MKNLKKLAYIALSILAISCSKKEDAKPPPPSVAFEKANTTVTAIPDYSGTTLGIVEVPITIDNEVIVADGSKIYIELDLTHTFVTDLAIELITPSGDSLGLIKRLNGAGNFLAGNKLVFNSSYTITIANNSTSILGGNYKPTFNSNLAILPINLVEKPMTTFFNGKSIKGIWKIKAYDCALRDIGSVNAWKIKFDTGALQ